MWVDLDVAADPVKPQNRGKKVYGSLLHCKAARAERTRVQGCSWRAPQTIRYG